MLRDEGDPLAQNDITGGGTAGDGVKNGAEPTVATYRYDAFGRRVEKNVTANNPNGVPAAVTRFYYSGQRIVEERNGAAAPNDAVLAVYAYAGYVDEPVTMWRDANANAQFDAGEKYYYHQNRMFSTYALTDRQGAVAERYTYEAYGAVTTYDAAYANPQACSRLGDPFTFTGRELDPETGLMHYRARTYDPVQGRFRQTDPATDSDGSCAYGYVLARPVARLDPSGLEDIQVPAGPADPVYRDPLVPRPGPARIIDQGNGIRLRDWPRMTAHYKGTPTISRIPCCGSCEHHFTTPCYAITQIKGTCHGTRTWRTGPLGLSGDPQSEIITFKLDNLTPLEKKILEDRATNCQKCGKKRGQKPIFRVPFGVM